MSKSLSVSVPACLVLAHALVIGCSSDEGGGAADEQTGGGGNGGTVTTGGSGGSAADAGTAGTPTGGTAGVGTGGIASSTGGISTGGGSTVANCLTLEGLPNECGEQSQEARFRPVELLLVMDKSASMDETDEGFATSRWRSTRAAINYALDPLEPIISVGLLLFPAASVEGTSLEGEEWCQMPPDDGTVDVPIDIGTVSVPLIQAALEETAPGGATPTAEALRRAYEYFDASRPVAGEPGDRYVLLTTDGGPNCNLDTGFTCDYDSCVLNLEGDTAGCPTPEAVAGGAEPINCCDGNTLSCVDDQRVLEQIEALAGIGVRTLVVGIAGSAPFAAHLDAFAQAGGQSEPVDAETGHYYYEVDPSRGVQGLQDAFRDITLDLIQDCEILLDQPPENLSEVNVAVDCTVIPQEPADDGSGWHYDDPEIPTSIILDGAICDQIREEGATRIDILLGCHTLG
jgi:hypothetical protein